MKKTIAKKSTVALQKISPKKMISAQELEASFLEVIELIQQARQQAFQAVNTALIELYWQVGAYLSRKLETAAWARA